ncbi:MAG: hypothetical protein RL095_829 [Verrucomicrobiota bacterium]|jgi:predicted Zn-dependent protease
MRFLRLAILFAILPVPLLAHGDLHDRIDAITEKLAAAPNQPALLLERSDLHFQHEEYDQALRDLLLAERLDPKAAAFPLLRARAYIPAGFPRLGIEELRPLVAAQPKHGQAWLMLAQAQLATKQMKEAALSYDQAVATLDRVEPQIILEQCRAWAGSKGGEATALLRIESALKSLGAEIPALVDAHIDLLVLNGKLDAACASLDRQAARLNRKDAVLLKKAELLESQLRYPEARQALNAARDNLASLPEHVRQRPDVIEAAAKIAVRLELLRRRLDGP